MEQNYTVGITTTLWAVGGTSCVGLTAGPRVNSITLHSIVGGSLTVVGVSTLSAGYAIQPTIPLTFNGPVSLFANNQNGTTGVIQVIKHLNGAPEFP